MDDAALAAAGWERLPVQAFTAAIGQTWIRREGGRVVVALPARAAILNDYGAVVHGGALMTFADIALGAGASAALDGGALVTVQLQYSFAGGVPAGALVTCAPELVRRTSQLVFMRGLVKSDDQIVGTVEGIFKALKPRE
jgi:acyl-coenzyme A thioesterase PaaI-like protein